MVHIDRRDWKTPGLAMEVGAVLGILLLLSSGTALFGPIRSSQAAGR